MLDVKFVVANAEAVKANAARKKAACDVDRIVELERQRVELTTKENDLQAELNKVNKGVGPIIGMLKKAKGGPPTDADREKIAAALDKAVDRAAQPDMHAKLAAAMEDGVDALQAALKALGEDRGQITQQVKEVEAERDAELSRVPNMIHESVPKGKSAADNKVVAEHGDAPTFDGFKPLPHWDLAQNLGLLHMETGAKLAGSGFYAAKGDLARLEWALISYFLDCAHKAGYTQWMVPVVASESTMYGTGYLPKMRDQVYHMDDRDPGLFLIPTAEAPLTSIHGGDQLSDEQLPLCYCAWSACFRREAGAAGTGTRGLLRVHQFNKVELFKLAHPDRSYDDHAKLREDAEKVIRGLGLKYRVLELCDADMSFSAAKCWDLEVWSPGVEEWLEVSSVSNFEEFQARRCDLRFRDAETKKLRYCHTINGSGLATPRVLVAILENGQQADGSIVIPEVLRPWMAGQERIAAGG